MEHSAKRLKKGAGPPHILAFLALVKPIVEKGVAVGQANFEKLQAHDTSLAEKTTTEVNQEVRLCKQTKCYDGSKKKLYLRMQECPVRQEIASSLTQVGFERKVGRAPPGHMERDLAEWLEQL